MLGIDLNLAHYSVEFMLIATTLWMYDNRYTVTGFLKRMRSCL